MAAMVRILPGREAAPYAAEFWRGLDMAAKKAMLWDVPFERRERILEKCWETSQLVLLPMRGKTVFACWGSFIGSGSLCLMLHFCFARTARKDAAQIGREAVKLIFGRSGAQCLLGLVPARYGHALSFLDNIGFVRGQALARACPVNGRLYDGILVSLNRTDHDA